MRLYSLWALVSVIATVNALSLIDSVLASTCIYYLKNFDFGCNSTGNGAKAFNCRCQHDLWLTSVMDCVSTHNKTQGERNHAVRHIRRRCYDKSSHKLTYSNAFMEEKWKALPVAPSPPEDPKQPVTEAFHASGELFEYSSRTFTTLKQHTHNCDMLGWGFIFFWTFIVVVGGVFHWVLGPKRVPSFWKQLQRKSLPGPYFREVTLDMWLISFVFFVYTVLATAIGYGVVIRPNIYIQNGKLLTLDLIGYRSGILSFALLPLVFFFGIRNNPFAVVTGMSYPQFSFFHKYLAVLMAIEAMIHTGVWTGYAIIDGGYESWVADAYWQWGIAGTVIATLMIFLSLKKIRDLMYEVFLFVHKLFSALYIVSMLYHVKPMGWIGWVLSMAGIWGFDVFFRVLRILVNGGFSRVKVEIAEHRVVRLVISNPKVKYFPGCYCFFYFLHPKYGSILQSHPFTMIKSPVEENGNLVVYFKARGGVTKNLYYGNDTEVLAFIEGPYGEFGPDSLKHKSRPIALPAAEKQRHIASKSDESSSDNLSEDLGTGDVTVGLAAGMGICAVLPKMYYCGTASKLYWVVNDARHINWAYRDLEWLKEQGCFIKIIITDEAVTEAAIAELKPYCSSLILDLKSRPRVAGIVHYNADRFAHVNLVVCGPEDFNYTARDALGVKSYPNVELELESFVW
ncbi:hypothetical protein DIURU_004597 [Diutina rugosa]|uniref:ferric-chelate reductase (NADPH) n=1 Tax=Diutina rugosa TaxID=5481 RepID=A0A642UNC2_DIURU|nr:uncharacterized protein DIURU_004597 [Diutina rugosa]KAA8898577.1 hypothetical protein DIURU_004597 [Diutina rugosa]